MHYYRYIIIWTMMCILSTYIPFFWLKGPGYLHRLPCVHLSHTWPRDVLFRSYFCSQRFSTPCNLVDFGPGDPSLKPHNIRQTFHFLLNARLGCTVTVVYWSTSTLQFHICKHVRSHLNFYRIVTCLWFDDLYPETRSEAILILPLKQPATDVYRHSLRTTAAAS